jgi:hypothetical protein
MKLDFKVVRENIPMLVPLRVAVSVLDLIPTLRTSTPGA